MRYTTLSAYEKHLKSSAPQHFLGVYLIIGKDPYQRKEGVKATLQALLPQSAVSDLATTTFKAEHCTPSVLLEELRSMQLFSSRRVILVENADHLPKETQQALEKYFPQCTPETFLVLATAACSVATSFYKSVEKAGIIYEIPEEKPWEKEKSIQAWIIKETASRGKQIEPAACQALVKQIGTDQATLIQELNKLFCYIGERSTIQLTDVGAVSISLNLETVWQLGEAVLRKDAAEALRIGLGLYFDGTAFLSLLRQLRNQLQTSLHIASLFRQGRDVAAVMQQFPYMKPFIAEKQANMAQSYGLPALTRGILAIDRAELDTKNSVCEEGLLLEKLLIKLTIGFAR